MKLELHRAAHFGFVCLFAIAVSSTSSLRLKIVDGAPLVGWLVQSPAVLLRLAIFKPSMFCHFQKLAAVNIVLVVGVVCCAYTWHVFRFQVQMLNPCFHRYRRSLTIDRSILHVEQSLRFGPVCLACHNDRTHDTECFILQHLLQQIYSLHG